MLFTEDVFKGKSTDQIAKEIRILCHRRFGVGADGVLLLKSHGSHLHAFEMIYYNSDGKRGSFCGNGSRCICSAAIDLGFAKRGEEFKFLFEGNTYRGFSEDGKNVSVNLVDVVDFGHDEDGFFADTGSPHLVLESEEKDLKILRKIAEAIRYSPRFEKHGINVNFLKVRRVSAADITTFERGVEDFTYACGTGAVASAVFLAEKTGEGGEFTLRSTGGELSVSLNKLSPGKYSNVWLAGPAIKVFESSWDFENSFKW